MPAIQVYRDGKTMIPVARAQNARAYLCPFTNKIYASKKAYVGHLQKLREQRMLARARKNRIAARENELWSQPTFVDVVKWINLNSDFFWQKFADCDTKYDQWNKIRDDFSVRVLYLELEYSNHVSNSHSCPHNGVENWRRESGKPVSYPGWQGRIDFVVSHPLPGFTSNLFDGTRIHLHSGGGNGKGGYRYEVKFFADDWPNIAEWQENEKAKYEKEHLLDMIKNEYRPYCPPRITIGCKGKKS